MNNKDKTKKIIADMLINLIGTGFPIIVLQLIVYPIVARKIESELYGQMQSIMSAIYLICGTLGGALSTTRLVRDYDYKCKSIIADFGILWRLNLIIAGTLSPLVIAIYTHVINAYDLLLITMLSVLNYIVLYLEVGLRLKLDYKRIFVNKVLACIGYLFGFGLFLVTAKWQYIFITSLLCQAIFCGFKSGLLKEKSIKSELMKGTVRTFADLGVANLLNKSLTYFDKLLLYPLLGGEAVSIYFAANIFGKLILQILEPITNVVLSYMSKENGVSKRVWRMAITTGLIFCGSMYIFCLIISRPILTLFYPQWVDAAMVLVPVATVSLCISSFVNILYPFTLKSLASSKQIIINGGGLIVYVISALALYQANGLIGCCWALLFSYFSKLLLITIFCMKKQ